MNRGSCIRIRYIQCAAVKNTRHHEINYLDVQLIL